MSNTIILITYRAIPTRVDEAIASLRSLIDTVQTVEVDCGGITMLHDQDDPTRITLIERWSSRESFQGPHMQQPHLQAFIKAASAFLSGPPEITFWNEIGGRTV